MRKIFVVLMILAIAGGGFAQDEGKGTWGTISGEAKISTTIDFYDADQDKVGMFGGRDDSWLKLAWDYEKGDWSVHVPLHVQDGTFGIERNDDGDALGKITYNPDSPLTVEIPFYFSFNSGNWFTDVTTLSETGLTATYETDEYMFKFGFDNLFGDGTSTNRTSAVSKVGGWYKFGDTGELRVSWGGAVDSEWWRASGIVITASTGLANYTWENIGGDHSKYGLAYKYNISPEFNLGISFAGNSGRGEAGNAMFTPGQATAANPGNSQDFVNDFLTNFIVGMKYDGAVALSLMSGMWTQGKTGDDLNVTIPLHVGFGWSNDMLSANADISARFGSEDALRDKPYFNLGAEFKFGDQGANDFWARARVKAIDLAMLGDSTLPAHSGKFQADLWVAYNHTGDGDDAWDGFADAGDGFYVALWLGIPSFTYDPFLLSAKIGLGYKGVELTEKLVFGVGATFSAGIVKDVFTGGIEIIPELEWKVIDKGNIVFTYNLGTTMIDTADNAPDMKLDINKFTTAFKWSF